MDASWEKEARFMKKADQLQALYSREVPQMLKPLKKLKAACPKMVSCHLVEASPFFHTCFNNGA